MVGFSCKTDVLTQGPFHKLLNCELWSYVMLMQIPDFFVTIKDDQLIWINNSQALLLLLCGFFWFSLEKHSGDAKQLFHTWV